MKRIFLIFGALLMGFPLASFSQTDEALTLDVNPMDAEDRPELTNGWTPLLRLSANFSFGTSSSVIGQQNGDSITLGGKLEGGYFFKDALNEWRNTLTYSGSTSSTPTTPRYVKSLDLLEANTLYMRSLKNTPWLGPYAQANLQAPIFKGEDLRTDPATYIIDGTAVTTDTLRLTDGFRPLRTKESVGFFARIMDHETLKATGRLGLGALQVKADGQYAIADADDTTQIQVNSLDSYSHVGVEAALDVSGQIDEKTSYTFGAEILIPFNVEEAEAQGRDKIELADVEIKASLMTKIYEWMSLNYELNLIKQPLLQEPYQATSLLTVNLTHQIF